MNLKIAQLARHTLAFCWIYHGLFPKLLQVAPLERQMTATLGLPPEETLMLIRFAGVGEILFGCVLWWFYQSSKVIWLNIAALASLLLFTAIQTPILLLEAFNPVTTNLSLITLSIILLKENRDKSNRS